MPVVTPSIAHATDPVGIFIEGSTQNTDTTVVPIVKVTWYIDSDKTNDKVFAWAQKNGAGDGIKLEIPVTTDDDATITYNETHTADTLKYTVQKTTAGFAGFTGLEPNTPYKITIVATQDVTFWNAPLSNLANKLTGGNNHDAASLTFNVTTNPKDNTTVVSSTIIKTVSPDAVLPACNVTSGSGVVGCFGYLIYYALFIPTSYLFALAGQFFDWTFSYSVSDAAYRSPFVVEGWGLIRDFCNIFFIFVLLYVAFSTILQIHGFNTKGMIINVVIIGLLMNFSLFAAQVIIDTSNILARVFYNSDAIKITEGGKNGSSTEAVGVNGEVPLSAAIVNKVNPQNIIINGAQGVKVEDKVSGEQVNDATVNSGRLGGGAFILITLLAIAVNVVGMMVFLSVGLVFVARVIGLWVAMIFVPLAFFSYTVPSMQSMSMAGWKNWWPETLKLAFLAPVFIFFIYLILKFLETGLSLINADSKSGTAFFIATIVPFAFIMILLLKAKDIAKDMSGKLGQSITGAVATVGGLALGGAALGAAVAGRTIIGRGMAAASRTDGAQKMIKYRQDLKDYNSGKVGAVHPGAAPKLTLRERIGDRLNRSQEKVGEVDHARHEIDSIKDKAGLKGIADSNLSQVNENKLKETFAKEKKSEIETEVRKGAKPLLDASGQTVKDSRGQVITGGESGFKSANRDAVSHTMGLDPNNVDHRTGQLTDAAKKKVEDELNVQFNAVLKTSTDQEAASRFDHLRAESKEQVNPLSRIVSKSNTASYDARNLSQTKADKRESIFTKAGAGLIAGIAMGVRTGLKSSGINHGSGQGDFLKDLGHTLTEAMKSAKVSVKVEESHGSDGHGDHGGGHGGGGGHH